MMSLIWEIELPKELISEVYVLPQINSVFIADTSGVGTTARLKLKRLDIKTGQILSQFSIRAAVNALRLSADYSTMWVNTDRRIYLLSSETLSVIDQWRTRVPSGMTSILQMGRELVMKSRAGKHVNLYSLDSQTLRRITVGVGRPLFQDISDDTFLVCCKVDGKVCRVNPTTRSVQTLFEGAPFNFCAVDLKSKLLCLSEGLPGSYLYFSGRRDDKVRVISVDKNLPQAVLDSIENNRPYVTAPVPAVHNRVHLISLDDSQTLSHFDLEFKFQGLGISENGKCLWVRPENEEQDEIRVISLRDASEVARFIMPIGESLTFADAVTGLIFTSRWEPHNDYSYLLRCWQT